MISLAAFVIKANDANAVQCVDGPVFVAMFSRWHWFGYLPDNQFNNSTFWRDVFEPGDELRLRVGYYANTP